MSVIAAHLWIDVASSHPLRCAAGLEPGLEDKINVASLDLVFHQSPRHMDEPRPREHDQVAALHKLARLFTGAPAHPDQVPHSKSVRHSSPSCQVGHVAAEPLVDLIL